MKTVLIVSRFSGTKKEVRENVEFVKNICRKYALKGVNPLASHLYYPLFLSDKKSKERHLGIKCGLKMLKISDEVHVFMHKGLSDGMKKEIAAAEKLKKTIIYFL